MLSILSLATLALSPAVQDTDPTVTGLTGEVLGTEEDFDEALGGTFENPFTPFFTIGATGAPRVWELRFMQTDSGWAEPVLIGLPQQPLSPAPLLVAFHSYGTTPYDILYNTDYFAEAMDRGWYVVAPLGAHKFHFNVDYAQDNISHVLDWFTTYLPIDPDRIYSVGFSMGGGTATNYGARHLEPGRARFAAIVNHTGAVSIRNVYDNSANTSLLEHPAMFGGSPDDFPFLYERSSSVDLSPSGVVNRFSDLARNLTHVPVRNWAVAGDPLAYLIDQTDIFHTHLNRRGGDTDLSIGIGNTHAWSTLDEGEVLDWLGEKVYTDPQPATVMRTLADRDGFWFNFYVAQHEADMFTPFRWYIDQGSNRLFVDRARNMETLGFRVQNLSLDVTQDIDIVVAVGDGQPLTVVVDGFGQSPVNVMRNGVSVDFEFDEEFGSVIFEEVNAKQYPMWTIAP